MRPNRTKTPSKNQFKVNKYLGISLTGPKKSNTCITILEEYQKENKIFLSQLFTEIGEDTKNSSDTKLIQIIQQESKNLKYIAVDAPLVPPKCMRCELKCPGIEKCDEEEILWLKKWRKKREPKKRPNKWFSPYLERCVENYLSTEIDYDLNPDHAWGSNKAPLYARAHFLLKRLAKFKCYEVNPKLSIWRLGKALHVRESDLKAYRHPVSGEESRAAFMDELVKQNIIFIYNQDLKKLVKDTYAFESFINAFCLLLYDKKLTEARPKNFPKHEPWILFPQKDWIKLKGV